jgi:hypothetical protein
LGFIELKDDGAIVFVADPAHPEWQILPDAVVILLSTAVLEPPQSAPAPPRPQS